MNKVVAGAIAVAAFATLAGAARAENNVCVWTGFDWACGDGQTFPQHFSQAQGPNVIIKPQQTAINPAKEPGPYYPYPNYPHPSRSY